MARINIEDSLFRDSRYQDLILKTGSRWTALGMVTEAWYLAQEFFLNEATDRMIPLEIWRKRKAPDCVIDVGLAEIKGDKVYVCGANEQFSWLIKKAENGKKGGVLSAQKRAEAKLELAQAPAKQKQAKLESAQANSSESNPLTLSLTLTHTLNTINTNTVPEESGPGGQVVLFEPEAPQCLDEIPSTELASNVLTALNAICFTDHRPNKKNMGHINARINEGYSYEDFVAVIKHRKQLWEHKADMREYLRPRTLFCGNFDDYLQAAKSANKPRIDPLEQWFRDQGHEPERVS